MTHLSIYIHTYLRYMVHLLPIGFEKYQERFDRAGSLTHSLTAPYMTKIVAVIARQAEERNLATREDRYVYILIEIEE